MSLSKGTETALLAIVSTASNVSTVGSSVDWSGTLRVSGYVRMGRGTGTAFTQTPVFRLQTTRATSPTTLNWQQAAPESYFSPLLGATLAATTFSGSTSAGATTFGVNSATAIAAGDFGFIQAPTLGNSEWCLVQSISGTTVTPVEPLVNAQTITTSLFKDQSEEFPFSLDTSAGITKGRLIVDNSGTGQAVIVQAVYAALLGP